MRVVISFFIVFVYILIFNGCAISQNQSNSDVINQYIEEYVNNNKYDIRLYDPPPPPELQDSIGHNGRRKPDSIANKLKPLKIYVNAMVKYDSAVDINIKKRFSFVNKIKPYGNDFLLEKTVFSKKPGIILEFLSSEAFFNKGEKIQYDENYGGLVSFKNLYYSKDKKKAFFVFSIYHSKLNSSTSAIYAQKEDDGTWTFKSVLISMS